MGYRERIKDALERRPYHELVTDDLYDITGRIRQIDDGYFILRHKLSGKYEVHNTNNIGGTYCFVVPYDSLDKRTLIYCRETSVSRDIAELVERHNRKLEESRKRAHESDITDRTRYVAELEEYAVNEDLLHEGYQKTHYIRR